MDKSAADTICQFVPPFVRYLREGLAKVNISPARFQILETLTEDGMLSMADLAGRLSVTKRNVTSLVDGLEKDGLAARRPHPTDRRSTLVELTEAGERVFSDAAEVQVVHLEKLFEHLTPEQEREMTRSLSLLLQALREQKNPTKNS